MIGCWSLYNGCGSLDGVVYKNRMPKLGYGEKALGARYGIEGLFRPLVQNVVAGKLPAELFVLGLQALYKVVFGGNSALLGLL